MSEGLGRHLLTGGSLSSLSLYRQTAACCFFCDLHCELVDGWQSFNAERKAVAVGTFGITAKMSSTYFFQILVVCFHALASPLSSTRRHKP